MDDNFRACIGYMLVIKTHTRVHGTSGSLYADVSLDDTAKEVALFLCSEDWNYEVVYWLLKSWANIETMDPKDVRDGSIPLGNVTKFKEMNSTICYLARILGDVGPASEKAAKKKYSGTDSVQEVLSGMMNCVNEKEQNIQQLLDDDGLELHFHKMIKLAGKKFTRLPLQPAWLGELASDVGWEGVAGTFSNFLSDSSGALVIEICTILGLAQIYKLNNKMTHKNFMVATRKMVEIIFENNPENKTLVAKCDRRGRTDLRKAALKGRYWLSTDLLVINSNIINVTDRDGRSPLYDTVNGKCEDVALLKKLLGAYSKKGTALKYLTDHTGFSPLHMAVSEGKIKLVKVLLSSQQFREKCLKRADFLEQTALHKAAKCGNFDTVKILLQSGANPYQERDGDGRTALHYAMQVETGEDGIKLAKLLLENCGSNEKKLLFLWASAAGIGTAEQNLRDLTLYNILLEQRENIAKELGTDNSLKTAACLGDIEMTKELLTRGYEIADIQDQVWRNTLIKTQKDNVGTGISMYFLAVTETHICHFNLSKSHAMLAVSKQIERIAEQGNDLSTISDNLGRVEYAHGLAALFLNPYSKPPIVVAHGYLW